MPRLLPYRHSTYLITQLLYLIDQATLIHQVTQTYSNEAVVRLEFTLKRFHPSVISIGEH